MRSLPRISLKRTAAAALASAALLAGGAIAAAPAHAETAKTVYLTGGNHLSTLPGCYDTWSVSARLDRPGSPLIAGAYKQILSWEAYDLITNADNTVTLRSQGSGKYLAAPPDGNTVTADRDYASTWEKFVQDGYGRLRAVSNGRYLTAQADGRVTATSTAPSIVDANGSRNEDIRVVAAVPFTQSICPA
ncbi:fascin domain-containing protein [Leifsonia xyli]|uniref:fascin domain-containing protein n=1 Tax=Leifsonia xyli TaxID=1575 RepID=UPI003D67A7F3